VSVGSGQPLFTQTATERKEGHGNKAADPCVTLA
jgi:hypothetical protein